MTTSLSAVVFDLDGTLVDTREDLNDSINHLRASYGLGPVAMDKTVAAIGQGVEHLVATVLNTTEQAEIDEAVERFRGHYLENCTEKTEPYPGMAELLRELHDRGVRTGVVTNKPQDSAARLVESLGLSVDHLLGAGPELPHKPDPAMLLKALEALEATPRRSIYVGDMGIDLDTARACDCAFVGVDFGFWDPSDLPTRTAVCVDSVDSLKRALLERD